MIILILLIPSFVSSQGKGKQSSEGSTVYDMVDPNNLEIDGYFEMDDYKANATAKVKKARVHLQADAKLFDAPDLTFRYGLAKNLEAQLITGYTGILTNGNVSLRAKKNRIISANKNATGLDALGLGMKVGLITNRDARPSVALTGILTLPNVGVPVFTPNNPGGEIDINLYNELNNYFDIQYGAGTIWSGYDLDPHISYSYYITPGVSFSDDVGLYLDLTGSTENGISPDNRFDFDLSFALNDYTTLDVYAGSSFNIKKFFYIGASFTATIPF